MTELTKQNNTGITKEETIGFMIPTSLINTAAVEKVQRYLPELDEKTRAFDRQNSQATLSLMTLTMLGGQSPYRMMRQVMAEAEKRKLALAEAQVSYAKLLKRLEELEPSDDPIDQAEYRQSRVSLSTLESKINGSFKDIATLIDAYNNIKAANNIEDWDEVAFEKEEKKHHVRRCFDLVYRNLTTSGSASSSSIEYCQQFGVHPQICIVEVSKYINSVTERINKGEVLHSNDLEEFLDAMGDKYAPGVDKTAERLFGKADFTNYDYMYKTVTK